MDVLSNCLEFYCNYCFSLLHIEGLLEWMNEAEVKILQEKHAFKRVILGVSQVCKP